MKRLTDETRRHLKTYLADVTGAPSEIGKREAFNTLLGRLFPGSDTPGRVAAGAEHSVRIDLGGGRSRRGSIDTFHGNAVIEFERSLAATGRHALDQLREYSAGVWSQEPMPHRPLLAVATDGLRWQTFRPTLADNDKRTPTPADVALGEPLRDFDLKARGKKDTLADFYFWLQALLFREQQSVPTAELFAIDFGTDSVLWGMGRSRLRAAWESCRDRREPSTAFDAWRRYLRYTYATAGGEEALEDLFLRHTYLVSLARLLAWAALSGGRQSTGTDDLIRDVLGGAWFRQRGLPNLVDDDFFGWTQSPDLDIADTLAPFWEMAMATLRSYDLSRLGQDVLKDVYEQLVNPAERHGLGEYYTPDWLCEKVVAEVLPADRIAPTLDPSCGSGGFLRAAIAHYRAHAVPGDDDQTLRAVLENVVGIDVHPLAVTVARVTYLLELRDLIGDRPGVRRDIQIPVYLADALFLPAEVTQSEMFGATGATSGYEMRFGPRATGPGNSPGSDGGRVLIVPKVMIEQPRLFDRGIEAAAVIARDIVAGSEGEDAGSLRSYLRQRCPELLDHPQAGEMVAALWQFTSDLADLIRREQDGIWAYIVRNAYRPAMLRGHFAFIVGNPPWLSYRYVADPAYQDEIRYRALTQYKLLPTDKRSLFTQMELATVFLVHALAQFGTEDAKLAFVMPRAVLTADQHAALRDRAYNAPIVIEGFWDLMDVRPLFNVPSCVLFAGRGKPKWRATGYTLPAAEWKGKLPERSVNWGTAEPHLTRTDKTGRLTFLGGRNALTTGPATRKRARPSVYLERFAQGATLVPRNFYFVEVPDLEPGQPAEPDGLYRAHTDPEQARTAKQPWKKITMSGRVEGKFLFAAPLAKHLLPFVMLPPPPVVLPYERGEHSATMLTPTEMRREGYRHAATWMTDATKHWERHRPNSAKAMTPQDWLDYQGKLTDQTFGKRVWVLAYNHSGTNISAHYFRADSFGLPFVADAKLYYMIVKRETEAAYLAAVLNSSFVDKAIKPFQSTGLQGERDVHKKPLELPIPAFDAAEGVHAELSALGKQATAEAAALVAGAGAAFPTTLAARRKYVRDGLKPLRQQMNRLVKGLLG